MKTSAYLLLILSLCLLESSCVEPYSYSPTSASEYLLIDAILSNNPRERTVRVQRGNAIDTLIFSPVEATGSIFKDGQHWADLYREAAGQLRIPDNLDLEQGPAYHIEITSDAGETYLSKPQVIPARREVDSLSFEVERKVFVSEFSRSVVTEHFIELYAHMNFFGNSEESHMLYTVDGVYSFQESVVPIRTCYIPYSVAENPITLLSSEGLATNLRKQVINKIINQEFLFDHMFSVYAHSIDEESYSYYSNIIRLSQADGNLYDEVPGPVRGNVFKESEENDEVVIGQVTFAAIDTIRMKVNTADLKVSVFNRCLANNPCGNFAPSCICSDCQGVFPQSSLTPPPYWND